MSSNKTQLPGSGVVRPGAAVSAGAGGAATTLMDASLTSASRVRRLRPDSDRPQPADGPSDPAPLGRVAAEHRSGYVLLTDRGELPAEVAGRLRHDADRGLPPGLPAVGDWVEYRLPPGERKAVIQAVRP